MTWPVQSAGSGGSGTVWACACSIHCSLFASACPPSFFPLVCTRRPCPPAQPLVRVRLPSLLLPLVRHVASAAVIAVLHGHLRLGLPHCSCGPSSSSVLVVPVMSQYH